jgi:hypothetical protein
MLKGKRRTELGYIKEVKVTDKWTSEMDLVKNDYNTNVTDCVWCMDIKYINTYEGFVLY